MTQIKEDLVVIDSIPIISGQGSFAYRPWGDVVVQPEQVDLKISSNFPGFTPITQSFQVLPGDPPLEVLADRDTISYGDTTTIKPIMENSDGTPSTGQLVGSRFTILEGDSAAFLYSPDSTIIGRDIFNVDSVRLYVPPATTSTTSSTIKLIVEALEPCSDCYASIAVRNGSGMLPSGTVKAKATKAVGKSSLSEREALYRTSMLELRKKAAYALKAPVSLTKNGKPAPKVAVASSKKIKATPKGISDYDGLTTSHYGMGIVTVVSNVSNFLLHIVPDTLSNRQTAPLTVIAVDNNGNEVPFDTSTSMDLSFDQGQEFVDFISMFNDTVTTLPRISYGTLRSGRIKVVARENSSTPIFALSKSLSHPKGIKSSVTTKGYQDHYPQMIVRVVMSTDATRFATDTFYVSPAIKVIVVADSIQPCDSGYIPLNESQTPVKVAVTVSGIRMTVHPIK